MANADARACADLTRRYARTFAFASRTLPARKQRAAFALYAFCRRADDIVDGVAASPDAARAALDDYRRRFNATMAGTPDDAVFRELLWSVRSFGVPPALLEELLDGVARDLDAPRIETWDALAEYAEGVASCVGEMLVHVFGAVGGPAVFAEATGRARTLGTAMQLTNILRDVGEDAARGRCYLPADDLARFRLTRAEVLERAVVPTDRRWRALLEFEIARARALYDRAMPGIALLEPDARHCTWLCAAGYRAILGAIERNQYDTLRMRARVSRWERARIVLRTPWSVPAIEAPAVGGASVA